MGNNIIKEDILKMRDVVSATVHNLTLVAADIERRLISVYIYGKNIELPIAELWLYKDSCKNFLNYIKEKINE